MIISNEESCHGKKVFLTWKQATTHNNMILRRGSLKAKGKKLEKLHVYKCKECKFFHLGHAIREPHRKIKHQSHFRHLERDLHLEENQMLE